MIALLLLTSSALLGAALEEPEYRPYGEHEVAACLKAMPRPDGTVKHELDLRCIDLVFGDLFAHAANYPPRFETKEERSRAERDAGLLDALLELLVDPEGEVDGEILLRHARVNAIGHNLDLDGASKRATSSFERLLEAKPEHAFGHLCYGRFLVGTATGAAKSLPHLEKALALGIAAARYDIGIAHLMLGDHTAALVHLRAHAADHPDDPRPRGLIEAIESGRIERKSE